MYEHLIRPAVERAGFTVQAPSRQGTENIPAAIINDLHQSDLILADLSALNANVFFELGIRAALDKPVCLIWDGLDHLPFDTSQLNTFKYDHDPAWTKAQKQQDQLVDHILATVENSADGRNALWKYFGSAALLDLKSAEVNANDTSLPGKIEEIIGRLARIERSLSGRGEYKAPLPLSRPTAELALSDEDSSVLDLEDIERVREASIDLLLSGRYTARRLAEPSKKFLGL